MNRETIAPESGAWKKENKRAGRIGPRPDDGSIRQGPPNPFGAAPTQAYRAKAGLVSARSGHDPRLTKGAFRPPLPGGRDPAARALPERSGWLVCNNRAMPDSFCDPRNRTSASRRTAAAPDPVTGPIRPSAVRTGTCDQSHRSSTPYAPEGAGFSLLHNGLARKGERVCRSTVRAGREIDGHPPFLRSMSDYAGRGHDDELARPLRGRYK